MILNKFLLEETQVKELCVIREDGWRTGAVWIDNEDLFIHSVAPRLLNKVVKSDEWGTITIVDQFKEEREIPCHYIDI